MDLDPKMPPEFGEIELFLPVPAVSRQANRSAKVGIINAVRAITRPLEYVLDDEVRVDIVWFLHERSRWETDASADVDNIVKPLLDALCGPEGVLVDDCQVQSFSSTWMNSVAQEEHITLQIRYDPDHFLAKDGLVFVRIKDAMCYPVPKSIREKALPLWLDWLNKGLIVRAELEALSGEYYPARYLLPRGYFHRSRIHGFPVYTPEELMSTWPSDVAIGS